MARLQYEQQTAVRLRAISHARRGRQSSQAAQTAARALPLGVFFLDCIGQSWVRLETGDFANWLDMQLMIALTKRMSWFQAALQGSLEPNGIAPLTGAQSIVIGHIVAGDHRAIDIARNLGVSRQAVSQTLAELEKRGVVSLESDPSDGRSRIAKFRGHFEEDGNACAWIFEALEQELIRRIGKRRVSALNDALDAEWGDPPVVVGSKV